LGAMANMNEPEVRAYSRLWVLVANCPLATHPANTALGFNSRNRSPSGHRVREYVWRPADSLGPTDGSLRYDLRRWPGPRSATRLIRCRRGGNCPRLSGFGRHTLLGFGWQPEWWCAGFGASSLASFGR